MRYWEVCSGFGDSVIIRQWNPNGGSPCIDNECTLDREEARALAKELWYEFGEISWT